MVASVEDQGAMATHRLLPTCILAGAATPLVIKSGRAITEVAVGTRQPVDRLNRSGNAITADTELPSMNVNSSNARIVELTLYA